MAREIKDLIVCRDGRNLHGEITVKAFSVETAWGTVRVKRQEVQKIHYAESTGSNTDEVYLQDGSCLKGETAPEVIYILMDGIGKPLKIRRQDIYTIFFVFKKTQLTKESRASIIKYLTSVARVKKIHK